MIIETKELGHVSIEEQDIIKFTHTIYGFEEFTRFVLLNDKTKPGNPFMWLQCVDSKEPCFVVADPHLFFAQYRPFLNAEDKCEIGAIKEDDVRYLVLATVPKNVRELSLNLKCPLVLNIERKTAMQAILDNSDYPMRCYLFDSLEG